MSAVKGKTTEGTIGKLFVITISILLGFVAFATSIANGLLRQPLGFDSLLWNSIYTTLFVVMFVSVALIFTRTREW